MGRPATSPGSGARRSPGDTNTFSRRPRTVRKNFRALCTRRPVFRTLDGGGFTLVEVIIGSTIGSFILVGVLSSFLMLGRSGMNARNYAESEAQIRRGLESFSEDIRMASNITWNSSTSITLTVPNNYSGNNNQVTYLYDAATTGATAQSFYRMPGDASSTAGKTVLVRNVSSLSFSRYNRLDAAAGNDAETKRIQLTMNVRQTGTTLVAANTTLVSASFTLRNKPVN
jgi:Tfp pilus assembly protein PilW